MSDTNTLRAVTDEVVDLHRFFVDWFTGAAEPAALDTRLGASLHDDFFYVFPGGQTLTRDGLLAGLRGAHGSNPDFRIVVRDVTVRFTPGDTVLATYTEWQSGAKASARPNNARLSTVLMTRRAPFVWMHLQETWLPEDVQDAGDYAG